MLKTDDVFENFSTIKKVIEDNNKCFVSENLDYLSLIYLGFCTHFFSYLNAYKTLFLQKNYYSCQAIHRVLIDLYVKVRLLDTVSKPEELAQWILAGNPIKKYQSDLGIKTLSDVNLCKYFDKIDNNYTYLGSEKFSDMGWLEYQYRLFSDYIHPTNKSCIYYVLRNAKDVSNSVKYTPTRQNEAEQFELLSFKVMEFLTNINVKIRKKYNINNKIGS